MFARVGIHACNGQTLRLSAKNTSFKPSTFATFQPPVSQHRSVTSLATRFSQSSSRSKQPSHSLLLFVAGGTSLFAYTIDSKPLRCEPSNQSARPYAEPHTVSVQGPGSARLTRSREAQVVESSVDLKSLSFGAVAGISTGIFIKKGLKAAGFLLGGVFVLLQVGHILATQHCLVHLLTFVIVVASTSPPAACSMSTGRPWPRAMTASSTATQEQAPAQN